MSADQISGLDISLRDGRSLSDFLSDLQFRRRLSPRTIEAYKNDLEIFSDFLHNIIKKSFSGSTRDDIVAFFIECKADGDSARTRSRRLSALKTFFKYLNQTGRITQSPVHGLKGSSLPARLPEVLTTFEMQALLDEGLRGNKNQRRAGMLLELLYATGLRISEALNLKMQHIVFQEGTILVESGKGAKGRVAVMPPTTSDHLRQYIDEIRPLILESGYSPYVFPTKTGSALSRQAAWSDLRKLANATGIKTKLHPHLLRHTCATHLLDNGCDLRTVQLLLGHADISTTEIYTHVVESRKRRAFQQFHPRAK
jgi:integrase/recombinase XerD